MVKQSTPRTFSTTGKSKKTAVNSGIFSESGGSQKRDPLPKPSSGQSKADVSDLRGAMAMPRKHGAREGKSADAVLKYAKTVNSEKG